MVKWFIGAFAILAAIAGVYVFILLPPKVDAEMNSVIEHASYEISDQALALHKTLRVADLHTDTTLWKRNPLNRHDRGHVDLPRLKEGRVRLQVFSATTKSPTNQNYTRNKDEGDRILSLAIAQLWPLKTWNSILHRALYQAKRLERLDKEAGNAFTLVRNQRDLAQTLEDGGIAGLFLIEGAHPLEGDIANLDRLYDAGLRIVGLQHFFDNRLGGSLHGISGGGLTEFGHEVVTRASEKLMIIDVAHSSEAVVRDVLSTTSRPIIVSHTGLKGHCDTPRNLPDALMLEIAEKGGLIGIGFWDAAICDATPKGIADAIRYAVDLLGSKHVALGSDFDGTIAAPIDSSEMNAITAALIDAGLDTETIRAVMGENAIAFFQENLPK